MFRLFVCSEPIFVKRRANRNTYVCLPLPLHDRALHVDADMGEEGKPTDDNHDDGGTHRQYDLHLGHTAAAAARSQHTPRNRRHSAAANPTSTANSSGRGLPDVAIATERSESPTKRPGSPSLNSSSPNSATACPSKRVASMSKSFGLPATGQNSLGNLYARHDLPGHFNFSAYHSITSLCHFCCLLVVRPTTSLRLFGMTC